MVCNEVRKDYLLDRWVIIAIERSRRPTDFIKSKAFSLTEKTCPLCVGNEDLTPPAVLLYLEDKGRILKDADNHKPRKKNWIIRVVPNLYPAFSNPKDCNCSKSKWPSKLIHAIGHHEVLIESPDHNEKLSSINSEQLVNLINAYIDRLIFLASKSYVKHVAIFRNYGKEAGASLSHAHSQIIAMPILPKILENEIETSKNFYAKNKKCVFCDILENEKKGPRLIFQNNGFVVFTPYASIQPLEFWIIPKKHSSTLSTLSTGEKVLFAESIKKIFSALEILVNDPPYNFGLHLSIDKKTEKYYHWHLEVYPKLSIWAGFEKSTGVYINTVPPENAASELRKVIENG